MDDYDVAYLNDTPTPVHLRAGLSVTPETYGYSGGNSVGDAAVEGPFTIPLSALVDGTNFIAVKVFQQALGSSDITFGYELTAVVDSIELASRVLKLSYAGGNLQFTWGDPNAVLYEADSIDAPAEAWRPVGSGGMAQVTPTFGQRFYSLEK